MGMNLGELLFGSGDKMQNVTMYKPEDYNAWSQYLNSSPGMNLYQGYLAKLMAPYFGNTAQGNVNAGWGQMSSGVLPQLASSLLQGQKRGEIKQGKPGILPIIGAAIGGIYGGPQGASIGAQAGQDIMGNSTYQYQALPGSRFSYMENPSYTAWGQNVSDMSKNMKYMF